MSGLNAVGAERAVKTGPKPKAPLARFVQFIRPQENGCWLWVGGCYGNGYGSFGVGSLTEGTRRKVLAHRFAYEQWNGPLAPGLVVDHLCRTPQCVNPDHLEAVTQQVNVKRGRRWETAA